MNKFKRFSVTVGMILALGGVVVAQKSEKVSAARHPNLAAAQRLCQEAVQRISAAQEANEFDMGGHAKKAKTLLDEANSELKMAAEAANRNRR